MAASASKIASTATGSVSSTISTAFTTDEITIISTVIATVNPADITRQILRISKYANRIRDIIQKKYGMLLPVSNAHVYDIRTINGTSIVLCIGTINDSLGFGFFIIGNIIDVFIPSSGAGFFTLKGKLTSISSLWSNPAYNINKMCLYEFTGYFQQAYGFNSSQITRIYSYIDARQMMSDIETDDGRSATIDISTLYDYILDHILSSDGINMVNMWEALERAYTF